MPKPLVRRKRLLLVGILLLLAWPLYRAGRYYAENWRYAHHVLQQGWAVWRAPFRDGYADRVSYAAGDVQTLYLDYRGRDSLTLRLYDLYGRVCDTLRVAPSPQTRADNGAVVGYGYAPSAQYTVPDLSGGLYLWENSVPWLLRGDAAADVAVLYPSHTVQAYNVSGGQSFYALFTEQVPVVSYARPQFPPEPFHVGAGLRWLGQSGYALRYLADTDLEDADALRGVRLLIVIGHSEYWTRAARQHFDAHVARGGHALVLSGNTMWWQVRYDHPALVCYKDQPDPAPDLRDHTVNWTAPTLAYPLLPSIGVDFHYGGYGRKAPENQGGWVVTDTAHPVFAGINWAGDYRLRVSTKEYDGAPVQATGDPQRPFSLIADSLLVAEAQLLAYDFARHGERVGVATAVVVRPRPGSGLIVNFPTTDWTSDNGLGGPDSLRLGRITRDAMEWLLRQPE